MKTVYSTNIAITAVSNAEVCGIKPSHPDVSILVVDYLDNHREKPNRLDNKKAALMKKINPLRIKLADYIVASQHEIDPMPMLEFQRQIEEFETYIKQPKERVESTFNRDYLLHELRDYWQTTKGRRCTFTTDPATGKVTKSDCGGWVLLRLDEYCLFAGLTLDALRKVLIKDLHGNKC
ncbi:MAG: hypothetical protein HOE61_02150 [Candidatus Marinimicrobia bacterium]|nr:hypothetical protein [Candidatus Neomarinimicrobiota bacterium]MBT7913103.1 hypothetical protein [Candidatus Bathyarchaeota archaeon]